ncbi:hypothetical protein BT93_K0595 [Corymbia citriodora subsp. variegata]|nr:hypothetical protein BT93_K0595 [Corymbia citriodora subsp. variegata]
MFLAKDLVWRGKEPRQRREHKRKRHLANGERGGPFFEAMGGRHVGRADFSEFPAASSPPSALNRFRKAHARKHTPVSFQEREIEKKTVSPVEFCLE